MWIASSSWNSMTLVQDSKSETTFMPISNHSRLCGNWNSWLYHNGVSRIASRYYIVLLNQRYLRLFNTSNQNVLDAISVMRSRKSEPKTKLFSRSNSCGITVHLLAEYRGLFSQLSLRVLSKSWILCSFYPPWQISPSNISFLHFGVSLLHKNLEKALFNSLIHKKLGLGQKHQ